MLYNIISDAPSVHVRQAIKLAAAEKTLCTSARTIRVGGRGARKTEDFQSRNRVNVSERHRDGTEIKIIRKTVIACIRRAHYFCRRSCLIVIISTRSFVCSRAIRDGLLPLNRASSSSTVFFVSRIR